MIRGMKKTHILFLALLCTLSAAGKAAAATQEKLIQEITRLEARYGGHLGFMAENLNTG